MGSMPDEHNDVPVGRPSSFRPVAVGRRRWRRAFRAALLLGLAGAALVLLAHTPPARAYVLRQAAAWLRARHGLVLAAGRLDYRLTSLTLSLHAISLSAADAPGPPFLRAERITVLLSPRALTGRPAFRRIEVVAPRLAFGTGPERGHEPPPGEAGVGGQAWLDSLEIGTLAVRDLDLVAGRPDTVEVRVSGASLDASGDGPGRLRARVGVARDNFLVAPGTHVRLDELAGDVSLVGSTVEVERLTARLPGGRLAIGGRVHLAAPRALDLRYAGEVDLGELRRWFVARLPLRGRAAVAGAVTGTLGEPRATFEATGTNVAWADGPEATMSASGAVSRRGLEVESLAVRAPSVTAAGRGHVAFARDDGPSRFAAEWRVANARALAPLFEVRPDRLPPAGVSGSIALRWPGSVPSLVSVAGTVRADVLAHADSGGRPGDVVLDGGDGHWRWRQRQALGGDTDAALDLQVDLDPAVPSRSMLSGTLALRAADVPAALRDLRRLGLPVPRTEWLASGRLDVVGRVAGTVAAPRLDASVRVAEATAAGVTGLSAQGAVTLDAHGLGMAPLVIEDGANRVELAGSLGLDGRGRFEVHVADAARLGAGWDDRVRPSGTISLTGEWAGSLSSPTVRAVVSGGPLRVGATPLDTVTGELGLESRTLSARDLRIAQGDGWLRLDGRADLDSRALRLDVASQAFDLAIAPAAPAQGANPDPGSVEVTALTVEAAVRGTIDRPEGTATARSAAVTVSGRALGEVDARLTLAGTTLGVDLGSPQLSARASGRLLLAEPWSYDVTADFANTDLRTALVAAGVAAVPPGDVSASLSATARASGTLGRLVPSTAAVHVRALDGTVQGRRLSLVEPGSVRLDGGRIDADRIAVTLGGATVRVQGGQDAVAASGGTIEATADVPLGELLTFMPTGAAETAWTADGVLRLAATWRGPIDEPVLTGRLEATAATIRRGGRDVVRNGRLEAAARDGVVTVAAFEASVLGGAVEAHGSFPLGWVLPGAAAPPGADGAARSPATLSARVTVAAAPLLQVLGRDAGRLEGTARLVIEGQADAPRVDALKATLVADTAVLTLGGTTFEQAAPTRLSLAGGRLTVDAFEWSGPGARLVAGGHLGLGPGAESDLRLQGRSTLRLIDFVLPARAFGSTVFDLHVDGPPGARAATGWIDLQEASFVSRTYGAALSGWSGRIEVGREGLGLRQLRGQVNGGDVELDGTLPLRANGTGTRPLSIKVREVFLEQPRGLRSRFDADLAWTTSGGAPQIAGTATIATEAYREPVTRMARMVSSLGGSGGSADGAGSRLPAFLAETQLDVALDAAGPLRVENSLGRVELVPHLTLVGTLGQPALAGAIDIADEGRVQLQGRTYRLTESRLDFVPAEGLLPRLYVNGVARIGQYDVYLRLRGPLDAIETNLASDPPLSERDLQTLVVTGQAGEAVAGGQGGDAFAVAAVSGDLLGFAGEFVGLDSVRISNESFELVSSDVDPATRLTVSQRFLGKFEVVLSENLDDNTLTWILIYRPRPGLEVRLASLDNTEQTVEFRQEIAFGPGGTGRSRRAASSAGARPVREVVASTAFTGGAGPDQDRLTGVLRLTQGDTFDYRVWREDVERLERVYFETGYFGARVIPKRTPVDASGETRRVALEYRIVRGPATELVVVGSPDERGLRERLALAWAGSDFPDFLDEELASAARAFLAEQGYLRATVDARVETPRPRSRRATVTVVPGPRSTVRRLAFEGHQSVSTATLAALADRDDLDELAWADPQPLVAAVSALYASRGHLAATVTTAPVEFSGDMATLRVRITEGPQTRVGAVRFAGVAPARAPDAAGAVGLAAGTPFAAGDDRAARVRLERAYRDLGFRDARAAVATRVDAAAGTVDLTFTVAEGPQYVVRQVRVTGLESTRPSLVDGAVGLVVGGPAGQAEIAATQRRLYELGMFSRAEVQLAPALGPDVDASAGVKSVDATVIVEEARRYLFRYGIEFSNEYGTAFEDFTRAVGVAADLRDRNFLGRGLALGVGARYENSLKSLRSIFSVPRFLGRPIRTNVYGTLRLERDTSDQQVVVDDDERALTLEQRWRPARSLDLSWGYVFDWRDIRLSRPNKEVAVDFSGVLASLNLAAIVDRRDATFDATRGWFHSSSLQWGLQALGSDFDYVRYLFRLFRYDRVGPVVLASAARWGRIWDVGGTPPITTLDLLFKAGGSQTVRGYAQDSLSALTVFDVPLGGTRLLILNGEVRFPVYGRVGGVLFADAGNTFADRGVSLEDLAVGLGFGLRIRTPIAPIRLDLGFPVPRRPGDRRYRWHFSIGQLF